MKRRAGYLLITLFTFCFGTQTDWFARAAGEGGITDCACTSVQCAVLSAVDYPAIAITHPVETWERLSNARWRDRWRP
jgi:hypothetical protein